MKGGMIAAGARCVFAALALAMAGGCATAGGRSWSPLSTTSGAGGFGGARHVLVENNSWDRVTVYIRSAAGAVLRLGDVESMNRHVFPVTNLSEDGAGIRFIAHPLAGQDFTSERFLFPGGATAVWTIENQVGLSNVKVR